MMNIKKVLGEKLKYLRKQRKFTQEKLAEMVDISVKNLSNIELGISFPKPETLEKLMIALDTTTEKLFANDHIKSNSELVKEINNFVVTIKDDNSKLSRVYKIVRDIIE